MKKLKYYFLYNFLSGHISIGNLTIYGRNAMHWCVIISTRKYGYICFRLPLFCFGRWWAMYFYCSPDATPDNATYFIGKKHDKEAWSTSRLRYQYLGHNFDIDANKHTADLINYFHPGNYNLLVDVMKKSKAEIKALSFKLNVDDNKLLIADLERYINIYGKEEYN